MKKSKTKKDKASTNQKSDAASMDLYRQLPSNHKLADRLFNKSMSRQ